MNNLEQFIKGWFIGNFEPTLFNTDNFEIAIKYYKKGDYENSHIHKIATEYTVIVDGVVMMNNNIYKSKDIIIINSGESTDFEVLSEKCITCVVKIPCVKNDKYE